MGLFDTGGLAGPTSAEGVSGFDVIAGTPGDDRLDGTDGADLIQGLAGDDLIQGLGGDDSLEGGAGDDTLLGGSGRDTLDGGGGHNVLSGGSGADLFLLKDLSSLSLDGGSGSDTASFLRANVGLRLTVHSGGLVSIENIIGSRFDDQLEGGYDHNLLEGRGGDDSVVASDSYYSQNPHEAGDKLTGGAGDDTVIGYGGDDTLKGGTGDDFIAGDYHTSAGVLTVSSDVEIGGDGADTMLASSGDTVLGGDGQDVIYVLNGDNSLSGGDGADVFLLGTYFGQYEGGSIGADLITDLATEDRIDLSHIDADTTHSGDQAFTLVSALDGHAGEAALAYDAGADETALLLDTDGDGAADITIRLAGDQTGFTSFVL